MSALSSYIQATGNLLLPEWTEQAGVMLVWPHADSDWAAILDAAWANYRAMAQAILQFEDLLIIVRDDVHREAVQSYVQPVRRQPTFVLHATNDTWVRDYGPLSVRHNNQNQLIDFRFNAWGGKYPFAKDNALAETLRVSGLFSNIEHSDLILEGGAIETDGQGALMATRSSVITASRNGQLGQQEIEQQLSAKLGIQQFHWLDCAGLAGDDTDGHVDTLARFLDDNTIVYATVSPAHPDYQALSELEAQLQQLRNAQGLPYRLIPLPPPPLRYSALDGRLLAATYANFLIINNAVLLPTYADENDAKAMATLTAATKRQIMPIPCNALIEQNGSLHCATMQLALDTFYADLLPRMSQ